MPNKLVGFGEKVLNAFSLASGNLFGKEEVMLEMNLQGFTEYSVYFYKSCSFFSSCGEQTKISE